MTISKDSVSMSDNGLQFTCKVENKYGVADTTIAVNVNGKHFSSVACFWQFIISMSA